MSDNEGPTGLPGRFLRKLGDIMFGKAETAFRTGRTREGQDAIHHYDIGQERPARRMMDDLERHDNGGPGWQDQKASAEIAEYYRNARADQMSRKGDRDSLFKAEKEKAEDMALKVAATENTHDHGRDR